MRAPLSIAAILLGLSLGSAGLALAQGAPAKEGEKKPEEKKAEEKKPEEKKAGDAKKDGEKKEEEKTYDALKDYEALMKKFGAGKRAIGKAVKNKDVETITSSADQTRYYATKIVEMDSINKGDRKNKDDYKKWSKELEANAKALRDLAKAAKPDWTKIEEASKKVNDTCESCHKVYNDEE